VDRTQGSVQFWFKGVRTENRAWIDFKFAVKYSKHFSKASPASKATINMSRLDRMLKVPISVRTLEHLLSDSTVKCS